MSARARLLDVVRTDATFGIEEVRGERCWVGRCIFCRTRLVVGLDGAAGREITVEHIVPRSRGGDDDPRNLAIACARCNHEKGVRHDRHRAATERAQQVTDALLAERARRWREPGSDVCAPTRSTSDR